MLIAGKHYLHAQRQDSDVNETGSDSEESQTGPRGAIHLVGTLADTGVPQGNLENDEPARSKWRRRTKHRTVCERDGAAGRGDLCTAKRRHVPRAAGSTG